MNEEGNSTINDLLTRGVVNIISDRASLQKKLESGEKLNVYLGIDPTATRIHLGHAVPLRKLQLLADLGHNVTFLIGNFTALIGDTSDKESERPILTQEEIEENFKTYKKQAEKFLDFSKVNVVYNGDWLSKLTFIDIVKLTQHFSVGDFVNRELVRKRLQEGKRVRLDETLYPIMQGYDSYYLDTDIQLGGPDQTFNMQAGRTLQKDLRNKESFVLVTDYLEGTDGRKMSKSWGNAVWVEDTPNEMYGKIMSLEDRLIEKYFLLATNTELEKIAEVKGRLESGENPMQLKKDLAETIVREIHGETFAKDAREAFENTFQKKVGPTDMDIFTLSQPTTLISLTTQILGSKSEAKRMLNQNAVDIDGTLVNDPDLMVQENQVVKIGKRKFVKIVGK